MLIQQLEGQVSQQGVRLTSEQLLASALSASSMLIPGRSLSCSGSIVCHVVVAGGVGAVAGVPAKALEAT